MDAHVLLVGLDYEGERREIGCNTVEIADDIAYECTRPLDPLAWLAYETWTNNPENGDWECIRAWPNQVGKNNLQ